MSHAYSVKQSEDICKTLNALQLGKVFSDVYREHLKAIIHVLLITLNKSDKDYSPTTLYNDYAISSRFFHWQSQSTTNAESTTGQRYIHHKEQGGNVLLFVHEFKQDSCGAAPYTILGI